MEESSFSGSTPHMPNNDTSSEERLKLILGLIAAGGIAYLAWKRAQNTEELFKSMPPSKPVLRDPNPLSAFQKKPPIGQTGGVQVRLLSPWGNYLDIIFTGDEWNMVQEISEMSNESIENVIIDVAMERRKMGLL